MARLFFSDAAMVDLFAQLAIASPTEYHQGYVQEQGIDQQIVGALAIAEHCVHHSGHHRSAGRDEHDDRGDSNPQRDKVTLSASDALVAVVSFHQTMQNQCGCALKE